MIIRISGGNSGIGEYLEKGVKSGREHSRNELDERIILNGSIAELESLIHTMGDCKSEKYLHITLSFKEKEISHDLLNQISEDFKSFAFSATEQDEFYYYAEAHNPKIKTLIDKKGELHERLPHIHAIIPQYNLVTGKKEDFLGNIAHITKYVDAFQEDINERYQLESPKDNKRDIELGKDEIINRHKITPYMTRKQIKARVLKIVQSDNTISSVDDLAKVLSDFGKVTVRNNEKEGQYINLKFADNKKAINLKDEQFKNTYLLTRENHCQRTTQDRDNKQTLKEWQRKAQEIRFVRPLGIKKREAYINLSDSEKIIYLHAKISESQDRVRSKSTSPISNPTKIDMDVIPIQDNSQSLDKVPYIDELEKDKSTRLHNTAIKSTKYKQRTRQLEIDIESQKSEWTNAINTIDMRVAIDYLAFHYCIDENVPITKNKYGHDRIKEGKRNYTISDYMAKKINLGWDEIQSSLEAIKKQQERGEHVKSQTISKITWRKFQAYESEKGGIRTVNAKFKQSYKKIIEKTQFSNNKKMTKPQAFAYRKMLSEQREDELKILNERTKEERDYFNRTPHERYLQYLHKVAELGDLLCLQELNRVYPMCDEKSGNLSFIQKQRTSKRFSPMQIGLKISISKYGTVKYKDDIGRVIMEDKGNRINVKIKTTENIIKALELAKKRFGTDYFEITNATERDLKAINAASQTSKTTVTIKEKSRMTINCGDHKSKDKSEGRER